MLWRLLAVESSRRQFFSGRREQAAVISQLAQRLLVERALAMRGKGDIKRHGDMSKTLERVVDLGNHPDRGAACLPCEAQGRLPPRSEPGPCAHRHGFRLGVEHPRAVVQGLERIGGLLSGHRGIGGSTSHRPRGDDQQKQGGQSAADKSW